MKPIKPHEGKVLLTNFEFHMPGQGRGVPSVSFIYRRHGNPGCQSDPAGGRLQCTKVCYGKTEKCDACIFAQLQSDDEQDEAKTDAQGERVDGKRGQWGRG